MPRLPRETEDARFPRDELNRRPLQNAGFGAGASGAQGSNGGTISRCRHTEGARKQRDNGDGIPGHVDKLDRVAVLAHARDGMTIYDRADVAGTQPVSGTSRVKITSPYISKATSTASTW